jgi:molybdate transport system substrate-binding protein
LTKERKAEFGVFGGCLLLLFVTLALSGCKQKQDIAPEIIVSAASSLKNAFEEIGVIYEKQTGIRPNFNFAASGILQQQIEAGAPTDVFACAGRKYMDDIQKKGLLLDGTRKNFAGNSLVLITPLDSRLKIQSLQDLDSAEVRRISIGNPKTVPAGQYAQEALSALKLWDKLQSRIIPAENVRQVLDYVSRGEVDAGLVYSSDTAILPGKIRIAAEVPKESYEEIAYPAAVLKDSENPAAAMKFIELVQSETGGVILAKYGFPGVFEMPLSTLSR